MVKIRRVDRALIDKPQRTAAARKTLTPREQKELLRLLRKVETGLRAARDGRA